MKKVMLLCICIHMTVCTKIISVKKLINLAQTYQKNEQFEQAIACYETIVNSITHAPNEWFKIGCCALHIGQFEYAIKAFDKVLELAPHTVAPLYNKGYTYKQMGKLDEAITTLMNLLEKHPNHSAAQMCLAYSHLMKGDLLNGYTYLQPYLQKSGKYAPKFRLLLENMDLQGKTILLIPEGGLGDTFHFIRYAQRLQTYNAYIIVAVQEPLVPLLSNCPYINQVISNKSSPPAYDAKITLMSLPAAFHDTIQTIPQTIPYIFPNKELIAYWKKKLDKDNNIKIGICWQASVKNDISRMPVARRGCPLQLFTTLFNIPGFSWYCLQQHDGLEQLKNINPEKLHLFDEHFDNQHGAFMDTAAVIQNLDLIITIDSAIAHLAGAMGKNVWVLLPLVTDWRWINECTYSPWYPTMTLFKQEKPFDWETVIEKIKIELQTYKKNPHKNAGKYI